MQVRPSTIAPALLPVAACAAMDPGGWSPFGPTPWLLVSTLTWAAFAATAGAGARLTGHRALCSAWAVLLSLLTIAAVGGLDPLYAWTGTPERHLGVLGWLTIAAAFIAGLQLRAVDRSALIGGVVAAGWVVAGYSVVEAVWRAPIRLDTTSDRLGGPFGSPAFLGAACALLVPVLIGAVLDVAVPRALRWTAVPAAAGYAFALVGSGTRAAWVSTAVVGAAVAAAVISHRWAGDRHRIPGPGAGDPATPSPRARTAARWGRHGGPVAAGVVVVVVALGGGLLLGEHAGSVLERTHGSASRLDEWRIAVRVIADQPIRGTGPEGYRLAVPGNVDAAYERAYGRDVMPDRAHSGVLDVAATGGLAAGAAYMALLALLAVVLWRAIRRGPPVLIGLAAGVGAYLLQQQLLFPLAELDPVAWLLAGAAVAWTVQLPTPTPAPATAIPTVPTGPTIPTGPTGLTVPPGRGDPTPATATAPTHHTRTATGRGAPTPSSAPAPRRPDPGEGRGGGRDRGVRPPPRWQGALAVLAGVLALACAVAGVLDVAADRLERRALDAIAAGRDADAVDLARQASDLRPDVIRYRLVLGRAEALDGTLSGVDRWLAAVDQALHVSPRDPIARAERGLALNRRAAITGAASDTSAALAHWRALVTDDPHNASWQLELGRAAATAGDSTLARMAWTAAADLGDPTAPALLGALPPP